MGVGCAVCDQRLSVSYLHIHGFLSCFVVLEWNSEPHFCFATLFPVWTLHRGGARGSQQGGRGRKDFPGFLLSSRGLHFLCGSHDHRPSNTLHPTTALLPCGSSWIKSEVFLTLEGLASNRPVSEKPDITGRHLFLRGLAVSSTAWSSKVAV